jgi:hypothetical protein
VSKVMNIRVPQIKQPAVWRAEWLSAFQIMSCTMGYISISWLAERLLASQGYRFKLLFIRYNTIWHASKQVRDEIS